MNFCFEFFVSVYLFIKAIRRLFLMHAVIQIEYLTFDRDILNDSQILETNNWSIFVIIKK